MSWGTNAAQRGSKPIVIITIDGIGDYYGLYQFCSKVPAWMQLSGFSETEKRVAATYKPLFPRGAWPRAIETKTNPLGGVSTSGELSFSLLDGTNGVDDTSLATPKLNILTQKFRVDMRAHTILGSAQAVDATTVTLASGSGITAGTTVIFVGAEAQKIDTLDAGTTYNVTRAALGTTAAPHLADDAVFLFSPYIYGRRVRYWVTWDDPTLTPATGLAEIGAGHHIDRVSLGDGLASWNLRCRDRLKHLDRIIGRKIPQGFIYHLPFSQAHLGIELFKEPQADALHFDDEVWLQISDEILRVDAANIQAFQHAPGWIFIHTARGQAGTRQQVFERNDSARIVANADPRDGLGSFRMQDSSDRGGPAETASRGSGTWVNTSAPVFCMLAVLTSSADPEDTTDPDNYTDGDGNFSALPSGFGVGIPASLIDFSTFWACHQRISQMRLDYLTITKSETARQWLEREILRPTGLVLRTSPRPAWPFLEFGDDKFSCHLARIPSEGDATTSWGDAEILTEPAGGGDRRPMIQAELVAEMVAGTIRFATKGVNGGTHEEIFKDTDFGTTFGNIRGFFEIEEGKIDIDVPGARAEDGATRLMLRKRALRLLFRFRRPVWRIRFSTDLSTHVTRFPGDLIKLTHSQLPSLIDGTRGWTDVVCEIISKKVEINESFVGIHWEVLGWETAGRYGRICPSAMIVSTDGSDATVEDNRYTDPASPANATMPVEDQLGFADGDLVQLRDRAGVLIVTTPAYQTVSSAGSPLITLDGDFGSAAEFDAGYVLEYVDRGDTIAQQHDFMVFMSDAANRTVGASSQTPWTYGDP